MAADKLAVQSLRWAVRHLDRCGLSDFVPRAFELEALQNSADDIISAGFAEIDLTSKSLRPFRRLLVPRPTGGYRLSTELDPLDAVTFAAIAYEIAPTIEAAGFRQERTGTTSGRVHITDGGDLFVPESWHVFAAKSLQFFHDAPQYKYVVYADISDFYGQIELASLYTALTAVGISPERSCNIVDLLRQCSTRGARGLPQGPTLSRLLAELILADADKFLAGQFVPFLRFADDFRIFAKTASEAEHLLFQLTQFLLDRYGFTFSGPKTQVVHASESRGFPTKDEEAAPAKMDRKNWWDMFVPKSADRRRICPLDVDPLPVQAARGALADGMASHPADLTESVYRNLPRLTPILRDVVDYLATDTNGTIRDSHKSAVREFVASSRMEVPFVRWVMSSLLFTRDFLPSESVLQIALDGVPKLGIRPVLEAAHHYGLRDAISAHVDRFDALDAWDRRGLLFWGRGLNTEEFAKLSAAATRSGDLLDRIVLQWAQTKATQEAERHKSSAVGYTAMASNY